ncbi:arginine N-methyltransferase, partial [Thraustotheca clavata]
STAPFVQNWQDHWVPVVFPLAAASSPSERKVSKGDRLDLVTFHDSLRIWFQVFPASGSAQKKVKREHEVPPCVCGMHLICNAERISMLTNATRNAIYQAAVASAAERSTNVLDVSDGSFCSLLAAAHMPSPSVTSIESKEVSSRIFQQIIDGNSLGDHITVLCSGVKGLLHEHLHKNAPVDLLVGEPFYYAMQNLPIWQALNFWYRRTAVQNLLAEKALVLPYSGKIMAMGVAFENLHKCFGEVHNVSGFDHGYFDALQGGYLSRDFPFPTYMYPYTPLTKPFELMPLNFMDPITSYGNRTTIPIEDTTTPLNAVILWVEYHLDASSKHIVATGPSCIEAKQAVRFVSIVPPSPANSLHYTVNFEASEGIIDYSFNVDSNAK